MYSVSATQTVRVDYQVGGEWCWRHMTVAPGAIYDGWRITGEPVYAGFDFFNLTYIRAIERASIGYLVRSEHGEMYLRPHHSPHDGPQYNKWLYPIEPA